MSPYDLAPLGGGSAPGRPNLPPGRPVEPHVHDEAINVTEIIGLLRRNAWLIGAITAVVLAISAYLVLNAVPRYRALGVVRLTDVRQSMTGGLADAAMSQAVGNTNDPLLSQLEVMKGRTVLGEVADREGLRLVPVEGVGLRGHLTGIEVRAHESARDTLTLRFSAAGVQAELGNATASAGYGAPIVLPTVTLTVESRPALELARLVTRPRDEAIDELAGELSARPREKTDAVEVLYTSTDPLVAQRVVNSAIEVFQAASAEAAQQQSRRRRIFLESQLGSVDSVLSSMQLALSEFRSRNQVYSSSDKISAQQEGLMGLDVRLEELTADRRMYETLLNELSARGANRLGVLRTLVSSPEIASNAVVAQLYQQLVRYETSRDSLVTGALGATAEHPDVQRLTVLIAGTQDRLVDAVRSHVASLDARIAALGGLRDRSAGEIATLPTTEAEEVRLVQQLATTQKMGDELRQELQKARIAEAVEAGQVEVVNTAPLPREPISSGKPLKLLLGLALGLMLGGGAAFVREQLNTTIRRREEVEQVLRVPGLAVIPQMAVGGPERKFGIAGRLALRGGHHHRTRDDTGDLATVSDVQSAGAEAFRMLRTNLLFSNAAQSLRTIVVTSPTPGEGKTTTIANLAASFAQQGIRVLLVDCDLRRARLHRVFDLPARPGLSDLVLGQASAQEVVRGTAVEGLSVLTAGTLPPNPAELLGGARMKRVLEVLAQGFDLVLLDTPPLMAAADAAILGANADGVLLVVRAGRTERGAAQYAMQQLHGVGARVVGAVLNDPDAQVPLYGGYYYYSYYGAEAAS